VVLARTVHLMVLEVKSIVKHVPLVGPVQILLPSLLQRNVPQVITVKLGPNPRVLQERNVLLGINAQLGVLKSKTVYLELSKPSGRKVVVIPVQLGATAGRLPLV
jgi:hypothetical protein